MLPVEQPFKTYTGLDGKPLDDGFVYFGLPNQDPIAHPVTVYWDAAGTLPAAQPLRTVNGYIMNAGTPANVFFDGSYSELVQDSKNRQVFYAQSSDNFSIGTLVLGLFKSTGSGLIGFIQAFAGAILRTVQGKLRARVSLEDFGGGVSASAATNDAAFAAAFAASNHVELEGEGTYNFSADLVLLGKKLSTVRGLRAVTLSYAGNGTAITVGGSDATSPALEGFVLQGTAAAAGGLKLAYPGTGCRWGSFRDIHITGFSKAGAAGVEMAASIGNGLYYNRFDTVRCFNNSIGWKVWSTDGAANGNRANANTFVNCGAQYNTGDGFYFDWAVGNELLGCDREANGGFGVNTDHVLDLTIVAGYSEGNTSGAVNKTVNGNVKIYGGRTIDAVVGTAMSGDTFNTGAYGLAVNQTGGIGMGGNSPIANGVNFDSGSDAVLKLSNTTYLTFDHATGMVSATRAIRKNGVARSSSAGALSLAGVVTEYVEVTLTENIASITFPTGIDGYEFDLIFTQGASPFTVAGWPAPNAAGGVLLAGGAFAMTAAAGKRDRLGLRYHSDFARWIETSRTQNM